MKQIRLGKPAHLDQLPARLFLFHFGSLNPMPLPKPPSRKGDLLQSIDYEVQAAPKADKRTTKARADDTPAQTALDLHDGGAAMVARALAQQAALLSTPPVVHRRR